MIYIIIVILQLRGRIFCTFHEKANIKVSCVFILMQGKNKSDSCALPRIHALSYCSITRKQREAIDVEK